MGRAKLVGGIATALAAIITSVMSYMEAREVSRRQTQVSKESYETLAGLVIKLSEQNSKQHKDLRELRTYVQDAMARKDWVTATPPQPPVLPAPPASTKSGAAVPPVAGLGAASAPPKMSEKPPEVQPPSFGSVEQKAMDSL